jgi:hypothetical protein
MGTTPQISGPVARYLSGLRFPYLFAVTAVVFVVDLFIPDVIPFADEIVLGFAAALLGMWRARRPQGDEDPS